ncbi:MAG: DUF167 domain-containing protein [bacterium]
MLSALKKILDRDGELYLRIKVRANASQTAIKQIMINQTVKIDVAAPPVRGQANQELMKYLAKEFAISKNNVKLIAGAGEPIKLIKLVKYE